MAFDNGPTRSMLDVGNVNLNLEKLYYCIGFDYKGALIYKNFGKFPHIQIQIQRLNPKSLTGG
jgi:hypothetical protein